MKSKKQNKIKQNTKKDVNKNKFGFKVYYNRYCTENYHSGEQFGEWRTSHDNSLNRVEKGGDYIDVTACHDFQKGDTAYFVWLEYSTGDSFGHGERSDVVSVALFKHKEDAINLQAALEGPKPDPNVGYEERYDFYFTSSEGEIVKYGYAPWHGYFEHLDNVYVEEVRIS